MTELLVTVVGAEDEVAELHSLYKAIVEDDDLGSAGKKLVPGAQAADTLGAEEIIRLIVDSPEIWTAVTTCVTAWLRMRRPTLRLKLTRPDGTSAEINATGGQAIDESEVHRAVEVVRRTLDAAP